MIARLAALLVLVTLPACLESEKGEESALPEDGAADTHRTPTDHGDLFFGERFLSAITDAQRYHAWEFDVYGDVSIEAVTSYSLLGQRRTDTVLYLYRQQANGGFGAYIARNDDYGNTTYSKIRKDLTAGRYRVLVKGYATTTRGKFSVRVDCTGAGCEPPPPATACVFGDAYNDLDSRDALVVTNRTRWTSAAGLSDLDRRRVVLAVQQSAHSDVTTAEEAFARVDQREINAVYIYEPEAARSFVALEYGAGDNSYGAYFEGRTDVMVAGIHDGDLEHCEVKAERCLLGTSYPEMRNDTGYSVLNRRAVTDADTLAGVEEDQALIAFREAFGEVSSNAEGLTMVDEGTLNIITYLRNGTGARFYVFEFGAGDTSLGAVFYGDSVQVAAIISDSDFYACTFFIER
jgi:hypothetical protein